MTLPFLTVLITTYNYGRFIEEAIDSVLAQGFPQDQVEIVVIDDGSTDDTPERVKKYGSRIRYFYQVNGGQAAALNAGFTNARGVIVALLDADDIFLPGKLARVAETFRLEPALGMVYHRMLQWNTQSDERLDPNYPIFSADFRRRAEEFFFYMPYPTSCIAFRRSAIAPLLPIPEHIRMLADAYPVDLVAFLAPIAAIPECLVIYRLHGRNYYNLDEQQLPPEARKKRLQLRQILFDSMRKWLTDNGYSEKHPLVLSFIDRWTLYLESDDFQLNPPGRLQFFRHLIKYNYRYRSKSNWRLQTINYLNAFASLVTGYKHFSLLEKGRLRVMESVRR